MAIVASSNSSSNEEGTFMWEPSYPDNILDEHAELLLHTTSASPSFIIGSTTFLTRLLQTYITSLIHLHLPIHCPPGYRRTLKQILSPTDSFTRHPKRLKVAAYMSGLLLAFLKSK
jgi:hypothetical protein